jgi:oxygen-dependent protoporphyrinogen oxidase
VPRIVIVGAGISGLAVGFELLERGIAGGDLVVLEAEGRPGGTIWTDRHDGFVVERGPNGFLDSSPPTLELVRRIGLDDRLLPSEETAAIRFIYRNGRLHRLPMGPFALAGSGLLSTRGKLRLLREPFVPRGGSPEESVFDFAARRIGSEAARVLVDAMVSGVFAGDAKRLELCAAFPRMEEMERRYGGLVRALLAIRRERKRKGEPGSGAGPAGPGGRLTSFVGGLEEIIEALARRIGSSLRLGAPAEAIDAGAGGEYRVRLASGETIDADAVVLSSPSPAAARLVRALDGELASLLAEIPSASIAVVATIYRTDEMAAPRGFGFLVPRGEGPRILGCLWDSSTWRGRAPESRVLLRTMIGGAHDPDATRMSDAELLDLVARDLGSCMGLRAEPISHRIYRYSLGIPQYRPGHTARLARIRERLARRPGLFVAGNSYGGISLNHCVAEAPSVAEDTVRALGTTP